MEDQERIADSFRKRAEVPPDFSNRKGIDVYIEPPIRAVRKRHHHSLTSDDHNAQSLMRTPPHPPLQSQKITVLEMLQDFDKFESWYIYIQIYNILVIKASIPILQLLLDIL